MAFRGGKKDPVTTAAVLLLIIGALNWGAVGLLNVNFVNWLLGPWPTVERIVYVLVGLAGLWKLYHAVMMKK